MKILFMQKIAGLAGSEKYWLHIMPALKARGIEVHFLGIYNKNSREKNFPIFDILLDLNITFFSIEIDKDLEANLFRRLHALLKKEKYDIIHTHLLHADLWMALYKIFNRRVKLVSTKHGYQESYIDKYGFNPAFTKKTNPYYLSAVFAENFIDRSFTISYGLKKLYSGMGICEDENLDVIHYGFDFNNTLELNNKYRFSNNQLIIVGRLTAFKGHRFALMALSILRHKFPDLKLVLVGSGDLESELRNLAITLKVDDMVIFLGFKANAREYMYNSDVVLVPSVSEGFGVVLLEAFSAKKPVVAFNVPSPSELIKNGETGLLAEPFEIDEYAAKIAYLLENREEGVKLAENAYEKLCNYFSLNRMVNQTLDFYKKTLNSP